VTYSLGVDLGTTFSAAAVRRDGVAQIVTLGHRAMVVPSVIYAGPDGEVLVGEPAVRRATNEPERVVREFKRRIGDRVPLMVGDTPLPAEHLMGMMLHELVAAVSEQQGEAPARVAVTFPANWGAYKQDCLAEAVRVSGVGEVDTLTEPEAAAIWYANEERVAPGQRIAVYDLGGGTFDAAVLAKTATGFEVLGTPHGIDRLGGIDIDAAILAHVCREIGRDESDLAGDSMRATADRLLADCVAAKEALSSDTSVAIPVILPDLHTNVRLVRSELEAMVQPFLDDTVESLHLAIRSAGLAPTDIDRVLLVGGASRMPLVSEIISGAFARPSFVDAHPKHVVALGAAIAAATDEAGSSPTPGGPPAGPPGAGEPPPPGAEPPDAVPGSGTGPVPRRRAAVVAAGAVAVVAVLAGALALSGSPPPDESGGETDTATPMPGTPGGEIVDLSAFPGGPPGHIDPALVTDLGGAQVAGALYDTLTEVDAGDPDAPRVLPQVAESYEVTDGGATWTFTIRDGLAFSDGEAVLPSSFVRGWERATDPRWATDAASAFAYIEGGRDKLDGSADTISGLTADDDAMTLTVRLDQANWGFDAVVSLHLFSPMPSAVDELADPTGWEDTIMVGNGPFVLEAVPSDREVVVVRNPQWDGTRYDPELRLPDAPFLERVTFRASADADAAYAAFTAGDGGVAGVTFNQQREARDQFSNTFDVPFYSSYQLQIGWDDAAIGGPQNQLLRRAMSQAIDRAAVNEAEFLGTALVADGITPPGIPGYEEGLCEVCTYDPDAARADLDEWQAQGNELEAPLRIQSNAPPGGSDPAVGVIVDNLADVGIPAVEEPLGDEFFDRLAAGECQLCTVSTFPHYLSYDATLSDSFHSTASPLRNLGGFRDGTFDRQVEDARATEPPAEREELFGSAESRLLDDEVAAIPLAWYAHPYIYADDVAQLPVTNLGRVVWEAVSLDAPS